MVLKIFNSEYAEKLSNNIKIDLYRKDIFDYDKSQEEIIPHLMFPDNLQTQMLSAKSNFEEARLLYEGFKDLTPLEASYKPFWVSLAHIYLFKYMRDRWNRVKDVDFKDEDYIRQHWFYKMGRTRQELLGLYWSVRCSVDESANISEKYKYTEYLFKRQDWRVKRLLPSSISRHREAVIGILQFMQDNDDMISNFFEGKANHIIMYFNQMASIRQLSVLKRDFFYNELVKIRSDLERITSRESGWQP